ncbi:hypothetical protein [Chitinophaga agri]|uniref:Uncharacterized protein n=1 Tax=Chitinophaga agri TaxID=2703787 RepID=A0A6B9ZL94_9BACT|nr:hypothetical protein [Chitinophaga agri]QHS61383.1 hypothetical protein GWR21_17790 [Chitinophaga agri]
MRRIVLLVLVISLTSLSACHTRKKTGCPTPRKNWGAEKLLDEMSAPKKKKRR